MAVFFCTKELQVEMEKSVRKLFTNRLIQMIVVLFLISFITFALTYLAPGDPAVAMYEAAGIVPTEALIVEARQGMGLDKPMIVQYGNWLINCLQGDFGISFSKRAPVFNLLLDRIWPTVKLSLFSLLIMIIISLPLGIISAVKKDKLADNIIRGLTFAGMSMPGFWVGLLLIYIFGLKLNLLPVSSSGTGFTKMILPGVTLAIAMAAKYTRQVRTAFLEELNQDYVMGTLVIDDSLEACLAQRPAAANYDAGSLPRFFIGRNGGGGDGLFLSRPGKFSRQCRSRQGLSPDSRLCALDCFDLHGN